MKTNNGFKRENIKRYEEFKTCEGDRIFRISEWRPLRKKVIKRDDPLFEFGNVFNDGDSDLQDIQRELYYFNYLNRRFPLSEFGICGDDFSPQIISFIKVIHRHAWKNKMKSVKKIHFINGYNMNPDMEWMLIEIDEVKNRVRVFECDPECVW